MILKDLLIFQGEFQASAKQIFYAFYAVNGIFYD